MRNNRITFCLPALFALLLGCTTTQPAHFGATPLQLRQLDFNINMESFFSDEQLFEGKTAYRAEVGDVFWINQDEQKSNFVQYILSARDEDTTLVLARYQNIAFDELELVTDSADEKLCLAGATAKKMSYNDLVQLKKALDADFGPGIFQEKDVRRNEIYLNWKKGDQVARLWIEADNPSAYIEKEEYSTESIIQGLQDKDYDKVTLFITRPLLDTIFRGSENKVSGALRDY